MSLQKSYLGSAKTYVFSKNQINNMEFLSARKRQLALLVIVIFFSLLVIKSLIKSNYPKSTPTHSEPPTIDPKEFQ